MLIIVLGIILSVAYITLLERKIMGSMQRRIGPNKVGILGLIQPLMDGVKLILKENILPLYGNIILFLLAPFLTFYLALANWLFLPLDQDLIVSEIEGGGILILLTITEISIFGILYAGWSANSKYPLLGSLRSTSQMISYSVNLSLIILTVLFIINDLSLISLLNSGSYRYLALMPMLIFFMISALAETNRAPFDLPEAKLLVSFNPTICWKLSLKHK
jgi:NADH-quinone oxidoreductase subunit H